MITIFTPSFADEADTNAQNLTVKEIVARLSPERFRVILLQEGRADTRIEQRPNTKLLQWHRRGNTLRVLGHLATQVPDVYFFPREGPLDAAFFQFRRALRWKTAVLTYIVSGGLHARPPRPTLERNIRVADAVIANSQYLMQLLRSNLGIEAGVIYDGIDHRFFFPPGAGQRELEHSLTVLFAGSFRSYKRPELVIYQAHRWPEVNFRLAGTGEEESKCRRLAAKLACSNVDFLGHLPPQQLGDEMRRADIFFFPSVIEGHPQVLGQAAACGLPCVAMNIYRPEFVENEKTGFLVDSDEELAQRLDLLIADPELRRSMAQAATIRSRKFNWDTVTERWQDEFENVVATRRNR